MFKKVVFVKKSTKKPNKIGVYEWLITCADNFFCFSPRKLELDCWYEIVYYRASNGIFRLKETRLIGLGNQQSNAQNIQQNIFIMKSDIIEIVNQDYKSYFYLAKCNKYVTHSCPGSCSLGFFCNLCESLGEQIKEPSELKNNDFIWEDKTNLKKLIHKDTWMAKKFLQ